MDGKPIRQWRVRTLDAGPGVFVWYDPREERLVLLDLTADEKRAILDNIVSVRAMGEGEGSVVSESGGVDREGDPFLPF